MFAMLRLFAISFVALSVVYIYLFLTQRYKHRKKLKEEFVENGEIGDLDDYIDKGMQEYEGSLRSKLILGVYIVPYALIALLIYVTNFM